MTLRSEPRAHDVIARIFRLIDHDGMAPGARLPAERRLAERLQVSRTALREAIAILEAMRIVECRSNSGNYLRHREVDASIEALSLFSELSLPLSKAELSQSVELRMLLEQQVVVLACRRRTSADLGVLRAILDDCTARLARGETIQDLDLGFHLALAAATGNQVLLRLMNGFLPALHGRRQLYFQDIERCRRSHEMHLRLLDAVAAQDDRLAAGLMAEHMDAATFYYREAYAHIAGVPADADGEPNREEVA